MKNDKMEKRHSLLLRAFVFIGIFWTIVIVTLATWTIGRKRTETTEITLAQARSFFKQLVTTRYWNSLHGGVYVPSTEQTQPNPFLDVPHRDVITEGGLSLTLINPAYMTRQIAEIASNRDQVQFHITSLMPIRPANGPKKWESGALGDFSIKGDEYYEWWSPGGRDKACFRYMAPLWTERPCLKCHSIQGYSEGDLRGGISVSIPAESIISAQTRHIKTIAIGYFSIWILGLSGIFLSFRLSTKEYRERSRLIDELQQALGEVKTLKGLIPICSSCKNVRNDEGYWDQIEKYIRDRSDADFSHCICPDCMKKLYPEYAKELESSE